MDFAPSPRGREYLDRVTAFVRDEVAPRERAYFEQLRALPDRWVVLPVIEELKAAARAAGLWNLYLPPGTGLPPDLAPGLTNAEYAPVAEVMGRSFIAPTVFNCNAPDTGNAEVLLA